MQHAGPVILWFRRDLRLADHRALTAAVASGRPVLPLHILDATIGGAARWWLHRSLASLAASLAARGAALVLRRGDPLEVLSGLAREYGVAEVFTSRLYEPAEADMERRLHASLAERGCSLRRFRGALLFEPEEIATGQGTPFKVFTPFWKACRAAPDPGEPLPAPARIEGGAGVASERLEDWQLLPTRPDWAGGLRATWRPGEAGAGDRLETFIDTALAGYAEGRDRPGVNGTSRLSPHLHFGEISPRQVWHRIGADPALADRPGSLAFLRELGWREFSAHLLHHFPHITTEPFRPELAAFPWHDDAEALQRWQRGRTGYPIVDAGMRELWQTGWMHNRVRMIVASFLTKDLLIHWREGAAWLADTLVDADLASNTASWQWVAGSGADAAPYFRVFNPVLQGETFDPDGVYVRRHVPELAKLPDRYIHRPWTAPRDVLAACGVRLGETYPHPMIDHDLARARALDSYRQIKGG
jgi:deoxyribodipyrimidine photo-lyase